MLGVNALKLIEATKKAFSWRQKPRQLTDSSQLSREDWSDLLKFSENDWKNIKSADWERGFDIIHWFSPSVFQYYLPSLIKVSIEDNEPNLIAVISVIDMLDSSHIVEYWHEYFLSRWGGFTKDEYAVIQDWVWWMSSFDDKAIADDSLMRALQTLELLECNESSLRNTAQ